MRGMERYFKLASVLILAFAMLFTPSPARADVGIQATGVITGFLTNDLNGNGIVDPGDPPLAGWTVEARNASTNNLIASDTTAINGFYSLTIPNNQGGSISVSEVLQPGWIKTFPAIPSYTFNIAPASGLTFLNNDFSNFQLGSISGTKFNDLNGNHALDAGEPGLGGWTIRLDGFDTITGTPVHLTAVTAADGTFSFTGLTNGTYTLAEDLQGGWINTLAPAPVDIRSGTFSTGNNFGNFQLGSISGMKFNDLNGNHALDAGEPGLGGWTIRLDGFDTITGTPVHQTNVTAADGTFSFPGLTNGTYTLTEDLQAGWMNTRTPVPVDIRSGTFSINNNFGNFQLGSISGMKFNDLNGNHALDAGEPGLGGWTIHLTGTDTITNTPVSLTTTTAADGTFSFPGLTNGTYTLTEDLQAGWMNTLAPAPVDIRSGTFSTGNNFGNFQLGSISGTKFNDTNGNSLRDACEPGLGGWTITLTGTDTITGTLVSLTTVTAADGTFSFTGLTNGTYTLGEVLQGGWVKTLNPAPVNITSGTVSTGNIIGNHNNSAPLTVTAVPSSVNVSVPTLVTFTVTSSCTNTPVANASVNLSGAGVIGNGTTDGNGQVVILVHALSPGTIIATATKVPGPIGFAPGTVNILAPGGGVMGQKFNDLNGNGRIDAGESGLQNWTIRIIGLNVPIQRTTTTDASGNYIFTNIPVGIYLVMEITQVGWVPTTRTAVIVETKTVGQTIIVNFGNRKL